MRCCARNRQALRKSSSRRIERDDDSKKSHLAPEHDPEKWIPDFGKRSCSTNKLERDDDSKKSHLARAEDQIGQELRADPGVAVVRGLIQEFRASMIVSTLRLTSRLLMLALGTDAFRTVLQDYWSKVPPQSYGSLQAEAFGNYLRALDLKVPHLANILEFEKAALATLTDDVTRVV